MQMPNDPADPLIPRNNGEEGRMYRKDGLELEIRTNDYSYNHIFSRHPEGFELTVLDWRTYMGGARCAICNKDIPEIPGEKPPGLRTLYCNTTDQYFCKDPDCMGRAEQPVCPICKDPIWKYSNTKYLWCD